MIIDNNLLKEIEQSAKLSVSLRMNYNLHESLESPCQRLINYVLPNTKLPIHRHKHTAETYFVIRGELEIIYYN